MAEDHDDELGPTDVLLHRGEANPRFRAGLIGVEILDTTPVWERYLDRFDDVSRRVLRLRQKVVTPTFPITAPRWVVDPDFDITFHVRRMRVPEPGTLRDVFDLAEVMAQSPLDNSRPLWTATLIEGLDDGRAASILQLSHALTDGVGGVEMFSHLYDLERDPPPRDVTPLPVPQDLSPNDLMRQGINRLPGNLFGGVRDAIAGANHAVGGVVRKPVASISGAVDYALSSSRAVRPAAAPSPVLRRRSLSSRTEAIDILLPDLHKAAKAAGGSINDAYLAGLCGALRMYHEALGVPTETLPMAVPVSLRSADDPAGGNRFAGVNLAAPLGIEDPEMRIQHIHAEMMRKREEPAIDIISVIAPVFGILPNAVFESLATSIVASDVQASNVPFYAGETFLAGAKVLRQYGVGPLPGVAMMVVLISRSGYCTITARYDRASVLDSRLFSQCLLAGFDEVLALGGEGRATPSSFSIDVIRDAPSA